MIGARTRHSIRSTYLPADGQSLVLGGPSRGGSGNMTSARGVWVASRMANIILAEADISKISGSADSRSADSRALGTLGLPGHFTRQGTEAHRYR